MVSTAEDNEDIVDDDLVSFFDLLARFDAEDKAKEKLAAEAASSNTGETALGANQG